METYEDESAREALETYREDNPLHDAFYVEVNDGDALKDTAEKIQAIEGIETVNYGGDSALMFVQALNSVRFGGAILVAGLSALAIFLIANTIKLTIYARSNEIAIMRDVGATNGFIRAPFVVEGMIIGRWARSFRSCLRSLAISLFMTSWAGCCFSEMFKMTPPHPFVLQLSLILLGIGMVVGDRQLHVGDEISEVETMKK